MALPNIPKAEVKSLTSWTNFHGTLPRQSVELYCTPDTGGPGTDARLASHGEAMRALIAHCFNEDLPLRALGARWSLSNIVRPDGAIVDPSNMNIVLSVKREWLTPSYRAQQGGRTPMFVQGGTHISSLNRRLGEIGLALPTSGASDGHRIAGCIATGTHGSAWQVGAVHDTVLAIHLMVGHGESFLLQPASRPVVTADVATWLRDKTGTPTMLVTDDELFCAAQVSLGSLGFVHAVIVETVPLYRLKRRVLARPWNDPAMWAAMLDLRQTGALHPDIAEAPYHFDVILHPYPSDGSPGAWVTMHWKVGAGGSAVVNPPPLPPDASSDFMGFIGTLSGVLNGPLTTAVFKDVLDGQLAARFPVGDAPPAFPGQVWGPTTLPPGEGTSTEIVVDQAVLQEALTVIYDVLREEADAGHLLLGGIGVRFVPRTEALLGMNVNPMNAYIELPSIRNAEVEGIYLAIWDALEASGLPFACHWGQLHGMTPSRLETYYGDRVDRWKAARGRLLSSEISRRVFGSPLLADVGLE